MAFPLATTNCRMALALTNTDFGDQEKVLKERSAHLFVEEQDSSLEVLSVGSIGQNDDSISSHVVKVHTIDALETLQAFSHKRVLFFLEQQNSWSRLNICESHFRKLCVLTEVHPRFLDVIYCFKEKIRPVEESYSTFFAHVREQNSSKVPDGFDLLYNLKYVARHGRSLPSDPFVVREIGMCHSYSASNGKSRWLIIQAPDDLRMRLSHILNSLDDDSPGNLLCVHAAIVASLSHHWREYLEYLEEQFSKIVDRGFFTSVKGPQSIGDINADFSDIRRLQILTDRLERLAQILRLNLRFSQQFSRTIAKPGFSQQIASNESSENFKETLEHFQDEQDTHLDRINTILTRAQGIDRLVQAILDMRTTEASKQINMEMQLITEQGVRENKLVKKLTQRAAQDTRSMMVIASITAVFLPAMFLATLFGSNFFVFSLDKNLLTIASNFWIYVLMALCFSGASVFGLYVWWRKPPRQDSHGNESV